jgi:hypothetical protein
MPPEECELDAGRPLLSTPFDAALPDIANAVKLGETVDEVLDPSPIPGAGFFLFGRMHLYLYSDSWCN